MIILRQKIYSDKREREKKDKVKSSRGIGRAIFWPAAFGGGIGIPGALVGRKAGMKKAEKEDNDYDRIKKGGRRGALVGGTVGAATGAILPLVPAIALSVSKKGKKVKIDKSELKKEIEEPVLSAAAGLGAAGGITAAIGGARGARAAIADDAFRKACKKDDR